MLGRQSSVTAAFKDGLNILFIQAGQNDLRSTDASVWLTSFSDYLAKVRDAIRSSGKLVQLGISTHNPRNERTKSHSMTIGLLPIQLCGFSLAKESAILLSIGQLIQLGVRSLLLQTKLSILTERIPRRTDRAIWRPIISVPHSTLFFQV